jgi:hypothetical protein
VIPHHAIDAFSNQRLLADATLDGDTLQLPPRGFILQSQVLFGPGTWFWVWMQFPEQYLPWSIFGATVAGLASYAVRL